MEPASETALVERLRAGDEAAFTKLVATHHGALVRLARTFVRDEAAAEEVAQETWLAVLDGIAGFEERAALRTWIFRILVNRARTRGKKQGRELQFEPDEEVHPDEARFSRRGFWEHAPAEWAEGTESELDRKRVLAIVRREIEHLPEAQRAVVLMRDVDGLDAKEVCNVLGIRETHQRVLLHRGRTMLRSKIEKELGRR
jgi:RNA polymerase sigma-70 factor (ECF subfamily)